MTDTAAPAGLPPLRAIGDLVREHARARPRQLALRQGAERMPWGELDRRMDQVAATLQRKGVQPRESIAICGANSVPYALLFLGALRAGVAVAPLPLGATPQQLQEMVRDSGARFFFADAGVPAFATAVPRIRMDAATGEDSLAHWLVESADAPQAVEVQPEWPFNIIYSSGTTGTPKGIVQPHAMRWAHVARARSYGYGPDAVALV